jgi:membrane protein
VTSRRGPSLPILAAALLSRARAASDASRALAFVRSVLRELGEDDWTTHAAAIAYSGFFSIFPLLLCAVALASPLVNAPAVRDRILGSALAYLPGSGDLIAATTSGVVEQRGTVGLVASVLLLVSGLGVFQAIVNALNVAFDVPQQRGLVATLLLSAGLLLGAGGLMLLSLVVTAAVQALDALVPLVGFSEPSLGAVWKAVPTALTALIDFATFAVLYKVAPNVRLTWGEVAPGAALAALLFEAAKWGFVVYVTGFANYAAVYGAIGSVIALLTWCYVSGLILLLGAEVSAELVKLRQVAAAA